jgi:hypothetical protein
MRGRGRDARARARARARAPAALTQQIDRVIGTLVRVAA